MIEALRAGGIQIVELHNHALDEEPRLFYVHFWANDDAVKLAQTLRHALDAMAVHRASATRIRIVIQPDHGDLGSPQGIAGP